MKFTSDVDIDFADRTQVLEIIKHIPATIRTNNQEQKHNTGIYVTNIPQNPFNGQSSIDYKEAEQRGYIKLDLLNVHVYSQVKDQQHLNDLMNTEPPWHLLRDKAFCEQLIHIGNHYQSIISMPEPVDSIPRLSMFLALIRPGKRYLIGKSWKEVAESVWIRPDDNSYYFKRSHSVAYAHLVVIQMNLLNLSN